MKLHNIWGYGQLFAYSGLDGKNRYYADFVGTLTPDKIGIRFELQEWIKLSIPVKDSVKFRAVMGDIIDAETEDGDVLILFANPDTVVGVAPIKPVITAEKGCKVVHKLGQDLYFTERELVSMSCEELANGMFKFSVSYGLMSSFARNSSREGLQIDIDALKKARYQYYENLPKCKNEKYERMYYKALSVNKVNVHTAEGNIPCRWTTPDRVPHRRMWLWDSVFHALAFATYNGEMAKDCIRSVLALQRQDGFISCMNDPWGNENQTQPQVLAWGTWSVYKKTKDKAFLQECVDKLDAYLVWDMKNRDKNNNGLLEWFTDPETLDCKSGESGQDDSPRWDIDEEADAMDFSAFQAHDAEYLAKIYRELNNEKKTREWEQVYERIKSQMNALLWDNEKGVYFDRMIESEKLTGILTPASFFPMMAGIPSKEQAERMVKVLTNPKLLWTKNPVPTIAKNHPDYAPSMWRGGVWLNMNYFCMKGLVRYGYVELERQWRQKLLDMVEKWYKKHGTIFEFYAADDECSPLECIRKGKPTNPPDWRKHLHSIVDFNWSSCFTLMFIQDETYYD